MRNISSFFVLFGMACSSDDGLKTYNDEPLASITSHEDGDEIIEGQIVTFRGSVSDTNHRTEDLKAAWLVGSEVVCEYASPDEEGITTCDVLITSDVTEIILEAKDPNDATDAASPKVIPQRFL